MCPVDFLILICCKLVLLVIVSALVQICCQKSAPGEMAKFSSHLAMGRCIVESICVNRLYHLKIIFLLSYWFLLWVMGGGKSFCEILILDFRTDFIWRYWRYWSLPTLYIWIRSFESDECYLKKCGGDVKYFFVFMWWNLVLLSRSQGYATDWGVFAGARVEFVILLIFHQTVRVVEMTVFLKQLWRFILVLRNGSSNCEIPCMFLAQSVPLLTLQDREKSQPMSLAEDVYWLAWLNVVITLQKKVLTRNLWLS